MSDLRATSLLLSDAATRHHYDAAQAEVHWREIARDQGKWPGVEKELSKMRAEADAMWEASKLFKMLARHPFLATLINRWGGGDDPAA